jgi:hypothetical protein
LPNAPIGVPEMIEVVTVVKLTCAIGVVLGVLSICWENRKVASIEVNGFASWLSARFWNIVIGAFIGTVGGLILAFFLCVLGVYFKVVKPL